MKTHKFIVEIEIPKGVTITEMKYFIKSSIESLEGDLSPNRYLDCYINRNSIKVVSATRAKAAELLEAYI